MELSAEKNGKRGFRFFPSIDFSRSRFVHHGTLKQLVKFPTHIKIMMVKKTQERPICPFKLIYY